ncbi:hypothetical protein PYCCODRAFT_197172 [Trametes coccinea BRFM310]|uniref:Uncharacterized protein n=1 Tax=Trametes coccinea (strain BRFM310) TaxID=1353009 RepID=A0A1Y2IV04_TRAC3|nr:hypothetical protein PYCCODRAFT_197172 [Trametes coccinea BRFM310]
MNERACDALSIRACPPPHSAVHQIKNSMSADNQQKAMVTAFTTLARPRWRSNGTAGEEAEGPGRVCDGCADDNAVGLLKYRGIITLSLSGPVKRSTSGFSGGAATLSGSCS